MNIAQIEQNLKNLLLNFNKETFIYKFLLAYGLPKSSITLLQKGNLNLSKVDGEISWKEKVFFKPVLNQDLHAVITQMQSQVKNKQRFVIVTDFKILLAIDIKTNDSLDIDFMALNKHFDFFMPWASIEKATHKKETEADVKAAEKMAKLFDEIKKDNPDNSPDFIHSLNVFLSRLLFCYFAEDTEIFIKDLFSSSIKSHTQTDGSDLADYLDKIFAIMNMPPTDKVRLALPNYLQKFEYVNGGLFAKPIKSPNFTRRSRQALLDSGSENWSKINPDIFGSMIQAVITPEHRGGLGMHYTSVPNIMKLIEPLFLNELYEDYLKNEKNLKNLNVLLKRIWSIKLFDPACGSGNFLIIGYKELRKLEMHIFKAIDKINGTYSNQFSGIVLNNFYGIELDDFAHEIATLSLWLAEHQMNQEFKTQFGRSKPALPLMQTGSIAQGNATRLDWETVCLKKKNNEIYIVGNPPYLGGKRLDSVQKEDTKFVFRGFDKYNNLDYIACWFYKASIYCNEYTKCAFVSTNSICQGTQVNDLWPSIFNMGIEIFFAVKDFQWSNNAKNKAAVICSIIGLRKISNHQKLIYQDGTIFKVKNINGYLVDAPKIFIEKRTTPLSLLPEMNQGNIPLESGFLRFNENEKNEIVRDFPESLPLFKRVSGSEELINGIERWCVWISNENLELAKSVEPIKKRIEKVYNFRSKGAQNAISCLNRSHQFCMLNEAKKTQIIVPIVSSERREYIPVSYVDNDFVIMNSALVIYDPELFIFSLINSKIHLLWVKTFAGKLKNDFRYSVGLCWFSFPFPPISKSQKEELEQCVFRILEERENHSEKTLAQLYDPKDMPDGLREAHRLNDLAVERCYRSKPFENDEERLEYLFKLYEQMIAEEKEKGTLFETEKKAVKKKK